ncbi:nitrogen regulation protein NR(II) [Parvularcula sp. IMCC14364]|uniref:two-component system sensor histidine kinase NtrB n=1 Tax=Parvularcula sp. IMCC14364 TaxID=3067902 RepID=UPI0027413F63|nr:ATP-binding protein [Parvularcula sp. IMCC14364]
MIPERLIQKYAIPLLAVQAVIISVLTIILAPDSLISWLIATSILLLGVGLTVLYYRKNQLPEIRGLNDVTQAELLSAISGAGIGYTILNSAGEILYAPGSVNSLLDLPEERNITGQIWFEMDHEAKAHKDARRQIWSEIITNQKPWSGIIRWVGAEGVKKYFDCTICPISGDRIILVAIDRTDRIQASHDLQEREKLNNYILNNIPVSITLHDTNRRIIYSNNYIPDRLGQSINQTIGKDPSQVLHPSTVQVMSDMYAQMLRTKEPVEGRTLSITGGRMAGTEWLLFMYPVFSKGKIEQTLVVSLDRTERVRLAREKEEFSRKLFETQKVEAVNKFAGGLAHELSNLLHPAGVYARALKEEPDLPDRHKYLDLINTAVLKAGEILRRTLSISRSDQDTPQPVDLAILMKDLIAYANDIAAKGIIYELLLPDTALCVLADDTGLRQVMMNLMNNAADAQGGSGNIIITLGKGGTPPGTTGMTPTSIGPFAWIDITDNGEGMEDNIRAQIFDPFFTTKDKGEGTGLGLPVVQGIVTGWGGIVTVDTSPGKGSTFRVWIPLSQHQSETAKENE